MRPRGTQSGGEKRGDGNFQARADEPLGTDSNQTISKRSIACWLLIGTKKMLLQAISNSDYRAHTAPLFSKLEILDIFQVNTLDTAKFMFRYHNNLPPLFLKLFTTNSQVHRHDTRIASNYRVHSCRKSIKKFSILYQGLRIWNCLPASITNLSSLSIFKNKVL